MTARNKNPAIPQDNIYLATHLIAQARSLKIMRPKLLQCIPKNEKNAIQSIQIIINSLNSIAEILINGRPIHN